MLDKRTTIALSVVLASLVGFILVFERGTLSTADLARRSGHVLTRFVRDRVTEVSLQRAGEEAIVFDRAPLGEHAAEGELADFRIVAPVRADADQDAVDSFLGALQWLTATRTLDGLTAEDRSRYGLDAPRFTVRFTAAGREIALRIGGDAPEGQGVYAAVEGEDRGYVVGRDFVESIDHELSHFRDKNLFPSDFYGSAAREIRLGGEALPAVVFEKADPRWQVTEPVEGWANAGIVDGLTRLTREARIARFVAEDAGELGRYGLDAPWREVTFTRPEDAAGTRVARLRVGAVCGEHAEERYAIVGDTGPVVCVLTSRLDALALEGRELRETRLLPVPTDAVESLVLEGAERLELRREDAGWTLKVGEGEARPADSAAVEAWIGGLRDRRALDFEAGGGHGLAAPGRTLTVRRSDADEALVLKLGAVDGEGAWIGRGDEPASVRFEPAVAELLDASPLRFRDRALVSAEPGDARSIVMRSGGLEERAVRGEGGTWQLETPISAEADRVVVRELARAIAGLRAERFVAERPAPEHGLSAPGRTVTAGFEEGETVTLRIGAETEGGAFAQLEGEPVFVLPAATLETLDVHLVSRDLLTLDVAGAQSIRIERAGSPPVELRRDGSGWKMADGAEADPERTRALLDRLSSLRASGVERYGAPESAALTVTVTTPNGATSLGFGEGEGEAFVPASRAGVDVTYRVAPDQLAPISAFLP